MAGVFEYLDDFVVDSGDPTARRPPDEEHFLFHRTRNSHTGRRSMNHGRPKIHVGPGAARSNPQYRTVSRLVIDLIMSKHVFVE